MTRCTYCNSDLAPYDPVFVSKGQGDDRTEVGAFCTYSCLTVYIAEDELTTGDTCAWGPA
jgi:hypothetical protein